MNPAPEVYIHLYGRSVKDAMKAVKEANSLQRCVNKLHKLNSNPRKWKASSVTKNKHMIKLINKFKKNLINIEKDEQNS